MAYNCGEGRLEKAIKKANSNELDVLIDNDAKYLPLETREYIKKILLVAMIGESKILDFEPRSSMDSNNLMQVEVRAGTKLSELAKRIGMKASELLNLNKQFNNGLVPKEKKLYKIMIPEDKIVNFYMQYELPEERKIIKPHLLSHYVKLGETLQSIAKQYHTTIEEIKTVNRLDDDMLELDKLLLIPISEALFEKMLNDQE
jgi:membrane-bound lytic murein transglycosylase D